VNQFVPLASGGRAKALVAMMAGVWFGIGVNSGKVNFIVTTLTGTNIRRIISLTFRG